MQNLIYLKKVRNEEKNRNGYIFKSKNTSNLFIKIPATGIIKPYFNGYNNYKEVN